MDPVKRIDLQNRIGMMSNPRFISAVLGTIFTIPILLYLLVADDVRLINETWQWRTAVSAQAEITDHEVVQSDIRIIETEQFLPSHHVIGYRFNVGNVEVVDKVEVPSRDESSVTVFDRKHLVKLGGTIPVFYLPANPNQYVLFEDPTRVLWDSVKRLCYMVLIALTCVVIALLAIVFYRPKKTERYLPAKIDVADIKIDA